MKKIRFQIRQTAQSLWGNRDGAFLFIFLLAGVVRLYGIRFGLPHTRCRPDEEEIIFTALQFFSGDLNPHFFNYPTLYLYLLFGSYGIYFLIRAALGGSVADFLAEMALSPVNFFLIARFWSAMAGTLTTLVVFCIAKRLYHRQTAMIAAFFMSIAYLHVRDSHFGTTDITMTFWIMCATLAILASYQQPREGNYIAAGIFTGLAAATKYGGIFLIIPMTVAHLLNCVRPRSQPNPPDRENTFNRFLSDYALILPSLNSAFRNRRIWLYGGCAIATFVLFTPFAVLDFKTFSKDFLFEMNHLAQGHGLILQRGWWYHLRYTLPYGTGWLMLAAACAGVGLHIKQDWRSAFVLYLFPVSFYLITGSGYTVFVRYMLPVIPFICIASAVWSVDLAKRLASYLPDKRLILLIVGIIAFPSIWNVICFDTLLAKQDNRLVAAEWINQHLPPGRTLYHSGVLYGQVQLPLSTETLLQKYQARLGKGGQGRLLLIRLKQANRLGTAAGYQEWIYPENGTLLATAGLPDFMIVQQSPLQQANFMPLPLTGLLHTQYVRIAVFETGTLDAPESWYDQLDAFYLPLVGFKHIQRPGPNLYIYQHHKTAWN